MFSLVMEILINEFNRHTLLKLHFAQNRAAPLELGSSVREIIDQMQDDLAWLKVEDQLKCGFLISFRNISF